MILQRLIMDDFRQFQNSNKIDFTPKQGKHVNIVFASNGVGKTTILTAINWCLYGGKKLYYGDLRDQFLNNNTFMNLSEGAQTKVSVTLSFEDRGRKYVITRDVTVSKEHGKQVNKDSTLEVLIDNEKQHYGQQRIDAVLGSAMKEYFFFDGEGIGKLADSSRPELIQKGIKNVMKIDTRQSALTLIQKAKQTFEKESTKIQAKSGETDIPEERIVKIENELNTTKEGLDKTKEDRDTFEKMLLEIDKKLLKIKAVKKEAEQKQKFENRLKQINKDLENLSNEQKDLVTKKAYLALSQASFTKVSSILQEKQKKGELPLLGIGKHFIEELLQKHRCICGEEFTDGDEHYKHLKEIMNRATVKSEIEGSLSSLGTFVEAHKNDNKDFLHLLERNIQATENLKKDKSQLEQKLEEIIDEIEEGLLDTEENLATKQKEVKQDIEKQIKMIGKLESDIETLQDELKKAKRDLELSTALTDEVQLIRDRILYCDKAISLLEEKNKEEIEEIRKELSLRLEKRFDKMLHSEKKAILDESFRLTIIGNDGQPSAKSRGEDKLISLIFISTLIDYAREKENEMHKDNLSVGAGIYPIVVDSPYGEFDTVYKKTISIALKDLAPQVIILLSQEQWSEDIESIFGDSLANAYRLIAHRPKLSHIQNDINQLYFAGKTFELEVQDDVEHTTIERLGVNHESI
jgi:DNA sulfur modification protein DndD